MDVKSLDCSRFDVVVIGGGISGASSAQHLAGAGYRVLLVEKDDFASAATSRSGRLLHCGLRYLAPARSPWEFLYHPKRFATVLGAARRSIRSSAEFIATTPERARRMRLVYPIYTDSPFRGWQVDIGARLLERLGGNRQSLAYRRYPAAEGRRLPFIKWLRDQERVASVVTFDDHQFDWPERITADCVLDAERLGAIALNYTTATALRRMSSGQWNVSLQDRRGGTASVEAPVVLNMAGAWIDKVNSTAGATPRKIVAVKGVHVLVRLPEECRGHGFMGINREKEAITCMPWGDLHFVGPTETVYEGDVDDVRPLEEDIRFIIDEANYLLPGIGIRRTDVLQAWAGVRPITYDPELPKGRRMPFSVVQDLAPDGLPGVFTITWAAIMFHRSAAREIVEAVGRRLRPSGPAAPVSYMARRFPDNQNSRPVVDHYPGVKLADLRHAVEREHAEGLVDAIFRRTPLGWNTSVPPDAVRRAAVEIARPLGWDEKRTTEEIAAFTDYVARYHVDDGQRKWDG